MITPKFKLSQNNDTLTVTIYAKFARISDTEINIDENVFIFYSSPYYLRLTLPGNLTDSEKEVPIAKYDADEDAFIVCCKKESQGQYFVGLDMLTDLLTPKGGENISKPLIEVLDGEHDSDSEDELNWFFEQKLPEDHIFSGCKYGFGNLETAIFTTLRSELSGIVDVINPDQKSASVRQEERLADEFSHFNEDHYLADLYESDSSSSFMMFTPSFYAVENAIEYSKEEAETLLKLPRKELLIDKGSTSFVYLSLVDILYSWCYNHRITLGENCAESAWNIAKLSPTLSWLDSFLNLKEVIKACLRRSLIFPLIRNWELSILVLQDTIQILSQGKKQVLKCFLEIHEMFNCYDPYYLLNQLYISNYCIWIQTLKEEKFLSLADSLKKQISLSKEDLQLELIELESAAKMVVEEDQFYKAEEFDNLNNLVESLDQLAVIENNFALSRNDNNSDHEAPIRNDNLIVPIDNDSSDSSSSDTDSSSDSDSNDSDSSSDSSSSDYDGN